MTERGSEFTPFIQHTVPHNKITQEALQQKYNLDKEAASLIVEATELFCASEEESNIRIVKTRLRDVEGHLKTKGITLWNLTRITYEDDTQGMTLTGPVWTAQNKRLMEELAKKDAQISSFLIIKTTQMV